MDPARCRVGPAGDRGGQALSVGALSYSAGGTEHHDQARGALVGVTKGGPYFVAGGVEVPGEERNEGASPEHRTLCRCEESAHKPFCGGAHRDTGLAADAT